jgi:hypothetical protein
MISCFKAAHISKRLRASTLGALFSLTAFQCLPAEEPDTVTTIRIRVANLSDVPFSEVTVGFPSQQENYGALASRAYSEYRDVEVAYRYASTTVMANGQVYRLVPTDFVGEIRLEPGSYTYTLDLRGPRYLSIGLVNDGEVAQWNNEYLEYRGGAYAAIPFMYPSILSEDDVGGIIRQLAGFTNDEISHISHHPGPWDARAAVEIQVAVCTQGTRANGACDRGLMHIFRKVDEAWAYQAGRTGTWVY